jgi:hypothetical protein
MTSIDHRQAASSTLEIPLGFLPVCVLAWRRRWTPFPADRHEKDHYRQIGVRRFNIGHSSAVHNAQAFALRTWLRRMELTLDTSSARLVDPDDHTSFAVVIECDGEPGAAALASGGVVGLGDHAWVRTDALRRLAGDERVGEVVRRDARLRAHARVGRRRARGRARPRRAARAANAKSCGGAVLSAPRHHPSRGRSGPE